MAEIRAASVTTKTASPASEPSLEQKVGALPTTPMSPSGIGQIGEAWDQAMDAASTYAQTKGLQGLLSEPIDGAISFSARVGPSDVDASQIQAIFGFSSGAKQFITSIHPQTKSAREVYDLIKTAIDRPAKPAPAPEPDGPAVETVSSELGKQVAALSTAQLASGGIGDVTAGYNRALRVAMAYAEKRGYEGLVSRKDDDLISFSTPGETPAVRANEGQRLIGFLKGQEKDLGAILVGTGSERDVFNTMKRYIDKGLNP